MIADEVDLTDDRSAVLLVRVWREGTEAFRARLTALGDAADGSPLEEVTVAVASSPGDVVTAVRSWLDDFLAEGADAVDTPG